MSSTSVPLRVGEHGIERITLHLEIGQARVQRGALVGWVPMTNLAALEYAKGADPAADFHTSAVLVPVASTTVTDAVVMLPEPESEQEQPKKRGRPKKDPA